MVANNLSYDIAREQLLRDNGDSISALEKTITSTLLEGVLNVAPQIKSDYDRAMDLRPFWEVYAPLQRGHMPSGAAYPWGEVGEKVLEGYLYHMLRETYPDGQFFGLPYGHDVRYATENAFIHVDLKSTGPTDNPDEVVSSPNQVTGDGIGDGAGRMKNSPVAVQGPRQVMHFQPELAPFYSIDDRILVTVTLYLKIVYSVRDAGDQPLSHLELICVPNGLLLFDGPDLYEQFPGLFTPGKDNQDTVRKRTRIKLRPLAAMDEWRCTQIHFTESGLHVVSRQSLPI